MTLPICPFDNLYIHILPENFILMLLALQVVAIEEVVRVVALVVVNVTVVAVLIVAGTYCVLVN